METRKIRNTDGGTGRTAILMGLFDGAAFLDDQLTSFADQTVPDWDLTVSDDGSQDTGPRMVTDFARAQHEEGRSVALIAGPGRGVAANFLSLLAGLAEGTAWAALSDQDDVWLPDRLERGQEALSGIPREVPALFGSATWIVNEDLSNRRQSPRFSRPAGFRNALVQSIAGGNTMLLNRAGVDLARAAATEALAADCLPVTHDWWLYQLISGAGGQVIRSEQPTVLYRQHGDNLFGTNLGTRAALKRFRMVTSGDLAAWTACNARALSVSAHRLTPENRALLDRFKSIRTQDMVSRLRSFRELGIYRQGRAGQAALWLAASLGRL
ncbi:glycosyltransferase [Nioella ostreopsis]|uniref:glycosyltransferase n=1 Tax=Nioella ostreopsis TaxID=2448479 RepID=UPI000FD9CE2B|nr:glycosyltransferase [Nioella ostreopsis]